ncbi:MAG: hypothetical protein AAF490_14275 [Chloroflexota bacterium]
MYPTIPDISFEENNERLKVTLPVSRNWILLITYTVLLITGIVLTIGGIVFGFRVAFSGERFAFWFTTFIIFFLLIMYPLVKYIFQQWQYHVTNREIVFVNAEEMIIRRPVSILGITTTYDRSYVQPIVYSEKYKALAFYYGSQPILFANGLPSSQTSPLADYLNERYFPDYDDDDDD